MLAGIQHAGIGWHAEASPFMIYLREGFIAWGYIM